jgi:sec-independent protein translocase protein TatA
MPSLGLPELLVIMVIVLLLFGYKRIGQLGKGLGEGIRNFKTSVKDDTAEEPAEKAAPKSGDPS